MKIGTTSVTTLGAVALLAAGWLWATRPTLPPVAPLAPPAPLASPGPRAATTPADLLAPATAAERPTLRSPAQFARWLASDSSLRGVRLDGAWDVDARGVLHPTLALRRRFDQLLTLAGEAKVDEITAFIGQQVTAQHGAAAAQAVLDAWQRYLTLQRHAFANRIDPADPSSLQSALAERQRVRREILGFDLATAFFAADEAQAQARLSAQPGSAPATDVRTMQIDRSTLDAAALARVQQADAAWADWQRRLADAKQRIAALRSAPELSTLQRNEAIDRLIAQQFDASEAVRVRALLHLSPVH